MERYSHGAKSANVWHVLANIKMQSEALNCRDNIGSIKVAGKQAVTIPPFGEQILEGRCRISPKVSYQVLVGMFVLIANILTKAADPSDEFQ